MVPYASLLARASRRTPRSALHRMPHWLLTVVLLALELAGWLPTRKVAVVQTLGGWFEPLLREVGIALPPPTAEPSDGAAASPNPDLPPWSGFDVAAVAALVLHDSISVTAERPRGCGWNG